MTDSETGRFPRTLADAFPDVRGDSGDWVYMQSRKKMLRKALGYVLCFAAFGFIGVLLAWRG